MSEKTCTQCGLLKPFADFYRDPQNSDGHASYCRECNKATCRKRYLANKVKYNAQAAAYAQDHQEELRAYRRQYHAAHRDDILKKQREYYAANKARMNTQAAEYVRQNADKVADYQRAYRTANRAAINDRAKQRFAQNDDYVKERIRQRSKQAYRDVRNRIIEALGGQCYCCGINDARFLTIDHINNDGRHDRKPNGKSRNSYMILRDIWKAGCPADRYRVACYNCNCARHLTEQKICPHQLSATQD